MSGDVVRAHAVVKGRVQMVGFRAFVLRHASELGLRGTVRNRPDGTLECLIEGSHDAVQTMIMLLQRGPSHARVDGVDVDYPAAAGELPRMIMSA